MVLESTANPNISHWDQETFDLLAEIGVSSDFQNADDNAPFVLLGRKGYPGGAIESYQKIAGQVQLNTTLFSHLEEGQVESVRIGPAADWDEMYWGWESKDRNKRELAQVDVYGVRRDNTDSLILRNIPTAGVTRLDVIDHEMFPFIRLSSHLKDSILRTAPQLKHWHVLHAPVPDAVVDPFGDFVFKSDTLFIIPL